MRTSRQASLSTLLTTKALTPASLATSFILIICGVLTMHHRLCNGPTRRCDSRVYKAPARGPAAQPAMLRASWSLSKVRRASMENPGDRAAEDARLAELLVAARGDDRGALEELVRGT